MRTISLLVLFFFGFSQFTYAADRAECLNAKGKTSPCVVDSQNGNLIITYKKK